MARPISIVFVMCLVFARQPLSAQLGTATISGNVTDSTGAAIVGASVTAVNAVTGFRRQTVSNTLGQYNLPGLAPGQYDLAFEFQGFKRMEQRGLTLQVDQNARIDVTLELGQVSESVEIVGQAPLVESQSATMGAVVDTQKILALPLNGRNFAQLALLVPGVNTGAPGAGGAEGFSASGLRANENAFQIDGTSNSDSFQNRITVRPNIDAIQEFKIQTNNYSAEFGKGGGAQVNVITRSGTREFHGGAWEFIRNNAFQARRFFDTNRRAFPCDAADPNVATRPACAPPFKQNQFGFNLGGPMFLIPRRGGDRKTFFFTTYEGFRQTRGNATLATVPSIAQRNGDFSQNLLSGNTVPDALGRTWRRGQIFDPRSSTAVTDASGRTRFVRDPFINNQIPLSRFDPVAARMLANTSFIPLPNTSGSTGGNGNPSNNFQDGRSTTSSFDQFSARIDHQFSPNDTIFGRFSFQDSNGYAPNTFPGFGQQDNQRQINVTSSYTKVLSPTMVNEFRFGYQGWFQLTAAEDYIHGLDYMTEFNIRGLEYAPKAGLIGSPSFSVTGFAGWGNGNGPNKARNHTFQPIEMLSFNKGRHFMKAGGELRAVMIDQTRPDTSRGSFNFDTAGWTGIDGVGNTGNELAAFELGLARQKARVVSNFRTEYRLREWGAFFQDDFKVTRSLTLNIGLRYMYFTPPYTTDNNYGSFVYPVVCPSYAVCGANFVNFLTQPSPYVPYHGIAGKDLPRSLTNTEKNDLGPRFGFAWQPLGKANTVIRGGYGIFYDTVPVQVYGDSLLNYPRVIEQQNNLGLSQNGLPPVEGFIGFLVQNPGLGPGPIAQFEPGPNGFPPDFHNAYVQTWNFGVQRQLPGSMVLEVAYVGTKTTRLERQEQSNTAEPLGFRATVPDLSNNPNIPDNIGSGGRNQFRRLVSFTKENGIIVPLGNVFLETSLGFANYNAGTLRLEKRQSYGLTFLTTYSFSKAFSDAPGFGSGATNSTGGRMQNVLDRKAEKGLAELDHRHRFTAGFVYELPFGKGRAFFSGAKGAMDRILGGWAVDGIFTLQSGYPMTIVRAGDPGSVGTNSALRPDLVCNPNLPRGKQTVEKFFNTACYVAPESLIPGDVRYGTAGRSTAIGPGLIGTDFSARKNTAITERVRTEFRAEFFNAANHPNFSTPNRNQGDGNFGKVTDTADPRIIQFGLKLIF
ncbi:MAG TPA: TonB-dependent receptor [Bryobacterales bacterium]|jgi:hypothetical protein|nr:TonB-dependent receptor [Bryobacterales bacterium]